MNILEKTYSNFLIADWFILTAFSAALVIAAYTDFRNQRIPNYLTFSTVLAAMAYYFVSSGFPGFLASLSGLAAGMAFLIVPYLMGGMGAGDVKLMGAVGSILGVKGVFESFLLTALFGGIYSLAVIFRHKKLFKGFFRQFANSVLTFLLMKKYILPIPVVQSEQKPRLCYGVAIALGTFTYIGLVLSGHTVFIR